MLWTSLELNATTRHLQASQAGKPLSWQQVLDGWLDGKGAELGQFLAGQSWDACYWECPPLTREGLAVRFECVLVDAPALAQVAPDPDPFRQYFRTEAPVAVFDNLGGDARLVAPAPAAAADFSHLLAFSRQAEAQLQSAFWNAVATAVKQRLGKRPLWLSTSGLGVAWLHVRLDRTPKYYQHQPYRSASCRRYPGS